MRAKARVAAEICIPGQCDKTQGLLGNNAAEMLLFMIAPALFTPWP